MVHPSRDPKARDSSRRKSILTLAVRNSTNKATCSLTTTVTALNTVWTYDIYQSYINKKASDQHYLWMGRMATIFGIALSIAAAYMANSFNNIMDMLQLVFAFVNAPLFATFLLGMFWKRTTGHGAFSGLLAGTFTTALYHGRTLPAGAEVGIKRGAPQHLVHTYPSDSAQN